MWFTVLIKGIHPDTDLGEWLSRKPSTTLDHFYNNVVQYLRKEEANLTRRNDTRHQVETVQSSVAVKQFGKSSGNIDINVQNKSGSLNKGHSKAQTRTRILEDDRDSLDSTHTPH